MEKKSAGMGWGWGKFCDDGITAGRDEKKIAGMDGDGEKIGGDGWGWGS